MRGFLSGIDTTVPRDAETALQVAGAMHQGRVVPLTGSLALDAARQGIERRLPLADSIVLATARRVGATLWTQHADFDGIEGVRVFAKR